MGYNGITQETCGHDAKVKMAGFKNRYECTRCHKIIPYEPDKVEKTDSQDTLPKNREELRREMFATYERQKILIKKRELLLSSGTTEDKEDALAVTHQIANLEDFIKKAENELRMTD